MEDKKISIKLLTIAIIFTLILTMINFKILNKYSNNAIAIIFPIFVFSYSIVLILRLFSRRYDKMIEEINLWDDYIIYAIIFNLKGNLNREAYDMYKKIEKLCFEQ